ncbi:MAG: VWA domain-containing protein, partial [Acidimicrobiales bacterium]
GTGPSGERWAQLAGPAMQPGAVPALTRPAPAGGAVTGASQRGPVVGHRVPGPGGTASVAVAASVRAGALRRAAAGPGSRPAGVQVAGPAGLGGPAGGPVATAGPGLDPADLREPRRRQPARRCIVVVVDTSGSMGTEARVTAATGAVLGLLASAYRDRHRVALVALGGGGADVVLAPTASVEVARARLGDLPTGGATPLAEGLAAGLDVALQASGAGDEAFLVVLTDGRATAGPGAWERALAAAGQVGERRVPALVLDSEDGPVRLGLAAALAGAMGAPALPVASLSAGEVAAAIAEGLARSAPAPPLRRGTP